MSERKMDDEELKALAKRLDALGGDGGTSPAYAATAIFQLLAERDRLRDALERPFTMPEIVEIGKAMLPYIESEKTQNIGAISHDVAWAARNILRERIAALKGDTQ